MCQRISPSGFGDFPNGMTLKMRSEGGVEIHQKGPGSRGRQPRDQRKPCNERGLTVLDRRGWEPWGPAHRDWVQKPAGREVKGVGGVILKGPRGSLLTELVVDPESRGETASLCRIRCVLVWYI